MENIKKIYFAIVFALIVAAFHLLKTQANTEIFIYLNSISSLFPKWIWANITFFGDGLFVFLMLSFFVRKNQHVLWSGFFSGLITLLLVNFLKSYFDIPRPAGVLDINSFNIIGPILKKRAFPSGHTATIFTLVGILGLYLKSTKIKIVLFSLGLLVGFSRIAVGAHWLSDILFGISIGLISSLIAYYLVQKLKIKSSIDVDLTFSGILLLTAIYFIAFYDSSFQEVFLLQLIFGTIFILKLSFDLFILIKHKTKAV